MEYKCIACSKKISDKDTVGINKKLLGTKNKRYYCIACLAHYLEVDVQDIYDKIEAFREEGCKLFI